MRQAFEKVLGFSRANSMFAHGGKVLVAVSGGPDSIALLDLSLRIADHGVQSADQSLGDISLGNRSFTLFIRDRSSAS